MFIMASATSAQPMGQVAPLLFFGLAALTCLSAWAIVISPNIVRMSVYLLLTLGGAAGMYFMLNAEFLAAIQLVVYAGGTLILIVFGIMLTSKNPFMQLRVSLWEMMAGVFIAVLISGLLVLALVQSLPLTQLASPGASGVGKAFDGSYGQVDLIGRALLSAYLVPFEVAAVLLLVVMIGAAYMARRRAA